MQNKPKVSILLLNWNQWDETLECIDSIFAKISSELFEIILVDNGSTDGSIEKIEEKYQNKIVIIKNDFNNLFAPANNQAYRVAQWEYIWILNTDTIITTDCLSVMIDFLEKNPEYGAATCKLLNADLSTQYYIHRRFPSFLRLVLGLLYKRFDILKLPPVVQYLYLDTTFEEDFDIEQAGGACILVKKEVVERIGWLFDEEKFALFYNDVDLCYRVWAHHFKIRFLSQTSLIHLKWQSTGKLNFYGSKKYLSISGLLFFKKHKMYGSYIFAKIAYLVLFAWLFFQSCFLFLRKKIALKDLQERGMFLFQILFV